MKINIKPKEIFLNVKEQLKDPYYSGVAAELAFFLMLSLVPTFMLLGKFSGLFSISVEYLVESLNIYAPKELNDIIIPYLKSTSIDNTSIVFFIMSLWFSSAGFNALMRISNYAYKVEKKKKNPIVNRLKAIRVTFLFLLMIMVSLTVVIYGGVIGQFITDNSKIIFGENIIINTFWLALRWPVSFVFFYVLIAYIYVILPDQHISHKRVLPGAVFSTLAITVASSVFTLYVSRISRYDIVYGSLSNVVILMLWLYIISFVVVVGILINIAVECIKKEIVRV